MRRITRIVVLFAAAVASAAEPLTPEMQIERLADRDPAVREEATAALKATNPDVARPALAKAARSGDLATADAAAAILLSMDWRRNDDPSELKAILNNYGKLSSTDRAVVIGRLATATSKGRAADRAAEITLRVLLEEPSERVGWLAADRLAQIPAFRELAGKLPPPVPPAIDYVALRGRVDPDPARPLTEVDRAAVESMFQSLLRGELYEVPALTLLNEHLLTDAQRRRDARAELSTRRRWLGVAETRPNSQFQEAARNEILATHVKYGPLPGMVDDLLSVNDEVLGSRSGFAAASIAQRMGFSVPGAILRSAADKRVEDMGISTDRAMALAALSQWYTSIGEVERAERALLAVEDLNLPDDDVGVYQARWLLYTRYAEEDRDEGVISVLEKFLAGNAMMLRNRRERTPGDLLEEIAWRRWRLERDHKQIDEKQVASILRTAEKDENVAIDVVPWLDSQNRTDEANEIFKKIYEQLKPQKQPNIFRRQDVEDDSDPFSESRDNGLAWFLARTNRGLPEAVAAASRAVAGRPNEAAYLDTLAEAKFRSGNAVDAAALEEVALRSRPRDIFMTAQLERFRKALPATQP